MLMFRLGRHKSPPADPVSNSAPASCVLCAAEVLVVRLCTLPGAHVTGVG
jgi:hypothetical protein